jgi:acyl-CoA synthetase (AMP-forming)/AMP-acid ligase II/acyl carrier protein
MHSSELTTVGAHRLIALRAASMPDAVAVRMGERTLTFHDLDGRAKRVAARLRQVPLAAEAPVAIVLERSPDVFAVLLGVLEAGGTGIVLDPVRRGLEVAPVLQAAAPAVTITSADLRIRLPRTGGITLYLDDLDGAPEEGSPMSPAPDAAALVVYHLGADGMPAGVVVTHRGLTHAIAASPPSSSEEVWASAAPLASASALARALGVLVSGGTVVLVPGPDLADVTSFARTLETTGTTRGEIPGQLIAGLAARRLLLPRVRELIAIGGELSSTNSATLAEALPGVRFAGEYTFCDEGAAVLCGLDAGPVAAPATPVTAPFAGTTLHVLDDSLTETSVGSVGELALGGLALPRPCSPNRRFVSVGATGSRVFLTGEAARRDRDGTIALLGPRDRVVIDGEPVVISEVERVVASAPRIREAAVSLRSVGDRQALVAFIVPDERGMPVGELRNALRQHLAGASMPVSFVSLDRLPRMASGRVDRRALPQPDPILAPMEQAYAPPRNAVETALVEIWTEALLLDRVGVNDDFLEVGGDSLIANQIVARVWDRFAVEIPLDAFFEQCTVSGLVESFLAGAIEAERRAAR